MRVDVFLDAPDLPRARVKDLLLEQLTQAVREEACDGREALDIAKEQPPVDLVITDVNMPNMDGLTLVRELRMLPHYRGVPLLVLTTEASTQKKLEGKAAGATGWVVKPFSPDRLLATIARIIT